MIKNEEITISANLNGFTVTPKYFYNSDKCIDTAAVYVFQTFEELRMFLQEHFTFRNASIKLDADNDPLGTR